MNSNSRHHTALPNPNGWFGEDGGFFRMTNEGETPMGKFHTILAGEGIEAMLGLNAARVFGFDVEKLEGIAAQIGPEKASFMKGAE